MNREIAEEILSENGVIVETAEDGDIAVDMVRKAAPGQHFAGRDALQSAGAGIG